MELITILNRCHRFRGILYQHAHFSTDKKSIEESYGFRTYRVLELALYHSLGKLPEPESTHDFF